MTVLRKIEVFAQFLLPIAVTQFLRSTTMQYFVSVDMLVELLFVPGLQSKTFVKPYSFRAIISVCIMRINDSAKKLLDLVSAHLELLPDASTPDNPSVSPIFGFSRLSNTCSPFQNTCARNPRRKKPQTTVSTATRCIENDIYTVGLE